MTRESRVYGILGWPIAHSRSPQMHAAAFAAANLDATYLKFPVRPKRLKEALAGVVALGIHGVNVTLPHKTDAIPLLNEVDPDALAIGAVNTIARDGDRLIGTNTDAPGLVRALLDAGVDCRGRRAVVLGAGGAARAAVVGLTNAGAAQVTVLARRAQRAEELVLAMRSLERGEVISTGNLGEGITQSFESADIVIQATSATLDDQPKALVFASSLPLGSLPKHAVVMDLVYEPRDTAVLRAARALDLRTLDGLGMLLHQGAIAFQWWTGLEPPLEVMRRALEMPT